MIHPHSVKNFFHSVGYHILSWKVTEDGSPFPYSVKKIFLSFGGHIITDCYCKMFVDLHSLTQKRFIFSHLVAISPLFAYDPFPHSVKNFFHSFGYHILTAWKVTEDGSPFPYWKKIFLSFGGHIITDCYCKMFVDLTQKDLFSLIWLPFPNWHMKFSCGYPFPHSVKNFFHSFGYHILTAWKVRISPFPYSVKKSFSHLEAILSIATGKWYPFPEERFIFSHMPVGNGIPTVCIWNLVVGIHSLTQLRIFFIHLVTISSLLEK